MTTANKIRHWGHNVVKLDQLRYARGSALLSSCFHQHKQLSDEWSTAIALTIVSCMAVTVLFWRVIMTLIDAWSQSRTFAHGFLVVPGSLYLAWCYRDRIDSPSPESWGWIVVVVPSGGWMAGSLLQNLVVQQVSVICMFPCLIYAIWGTTVFRNLLLPLGFLGFAIPIGTSLEPWLQDVTTTFITVGLQMGGVPFHRDGYVIAMPSGTWEVAADCGGLRYLLPGLALGYLYAAVMYRRAVCRIGFLLLCSVLLILANGLRAYGVIIGDHLGITEGTDHRLFSYTIYAVTIVSLAWVGRHWGFAVADTSVPDTRVPREPVSERATHNALSAVALLALAPLGTWWLATPSKASKAATEETFMADGQESSEPLNIHAPKQ